MNPDLYQELVKQISSLQKQVDALVKPEVGRWLDWTPTVTQGVAVARNISLARYIVIANTVHSLVVLTTTGAGTGGQVISIGGIPATIAPTAGTLLGSGMILDSGLAFYTGVVYANGVNDLQIFAHNSGNSMGVVPNFALANGDTIYLNLMWER